MILCLKMKFYFTSIESELSDSNMFNSTPYIISY